MSTEISVRKRLVDNKGETKSLDLTNKRTEPLTEDSAYLAQFKSIDEGNYGKSQADKVKNLLMPKLKFQVSR